MAKPSKIQIAVLQHMAGGPKLYSAIGDAHHWFSSLEGPTVRSRSTLTALHRRGWIERWDTDNTPFWRRDFIITQAGRDALAEAQGDVCEN